MCNSSVATTVLLHYCSLLMLQSAVTNTFSEESSAMLLFCPCIVLQLIAGDAWDRPEFVNDRLPWPLQLLRLLVKARTNPGCYTGVSDTLLDHWLKFKHMWGRASPSILHCRPYIDVYMLTLTPTTSRVNNTDNIDLLSTGSHNCWTMMSQPLVTSQHAESSLLWPG